MMRVRRGLITGAEGRLSLLQGLLGAAGFAAETLAEVLVIGTIGPAWMPVGLAGAALISLSLTATLARRPAGPRRLANTAGAAVIIGAIVWSGLFWAPMVAAFAFLLVSRPLRDSLVVTFGNLVAARFDPQDAKKAFPRLAATGQVGAICAGLTLPLLLRLGGVRAAVIVWPLLALAALLVAWRLPTVSVSSGAAARGLPATREHPMAMLRHSPLLWSLAIAAMLAVATAAAFGLAAAQTLSRAIPDPARLASLYSIIGAICSMAVLAVQALVLPLLVGRVGTARSTAIPPTLAMAAAASVVAAPGLVTGVAAHAGRLTLRPALQTPMEDILLNLLPMSERAAGRAWLRGAAVPVAGLVSSLLLAALAGLGAGPRIVAGLAFGTATSGLAVALIVRRQHRRAALALARSSDLRIGRVALPTFGGVDASVTAEIGRRLAMSADEDERIMLVSLLADLDPGAAANAVATLLPAALAPLTVALLAALAERQVSAVALLPYAPALLSAPLPDIRRTAIAALDGALAETAVTPLLNDPDDETALLAASWLFRRDATRSDARVRLRTLACSGPDDVRAAAAPLVARVNAEALIPLLSDRVIAVRRAAAAAAGEIAALPQPVVKALLLAACDSASAVRAAAVSALAVVGEDGTAVLVAALDDSTPGVRAAATAVLLGGGATRAESLTKHLPTAHGWGRATAMAILAHRAPLRWRAASLAEEGIGLARIERLAAARAALGDPCGPVGALLRHDVDDDIAGRLTRWEECIAITDGENAARIIRHGLSSEEPLARAHAQEALEAIRSPTIARHVAGLHGRNLHVAPIDDALDVLASDASHWRHELLTAAGAEQNVPAAPCLSESVTPGRDGTMLSLVERATLLRGVPPFADLPSGQLRLLAGVVEEIEIAAHETLVRAGTEGDHLYVVVAGQIALEEQRGTSGSVARIGTLGPGDALGEDAVFDGGVHVLNATAQTDCQLLKLKRDVLLALLDEEPALARALIAWLSARVRETTSKLAERTRARPRSVIDLLDKMDDTRR
jgi:CRP/FNR family cyclic AMP-dependent transcriptional regulator